MAAYTTIQGDTWDLIAHRKLGSVEYTPRLIAANLAYRELLFFPAGVALELPEIEETAALSTLPPWKR